MGMEKEKPLLPAVCVYARQAAECAYSLHNFGKTVLG